MESFPEDFTLVKCMKIIEENQKEMTVNVRKEFHENILQAVNDCEPSVKLDFPKNLWPLYKTMITGELLDIFGEVETITHNMKTNSIVSNPITEAENISKNIDSIVIRFMHE